MMKLLNHIKFKKKLYKILAKITIMHYYFLKFNRFFYTFYRMKSNFI